MNDPFTGIQVPRAVEDLSEDARLVYLGAYETAWLSAENRAARGGMGRNEFAQREGWKAVHQEYGRHPTTKHVAHPV